MRRLAILLAALVMALTPPPILAKSDKSPPGHSAKAEKSETATPRGQAKKDETRTPPGQAKKDDKPTPPGQADKAGKSTPPGQDKGKDKDKDKDKPPGQVDKGEKDEKPPVQTKKTEKDEAPAAGVPAAQKFDEIGEAQRVVKSNEALPLARIVAVAEERSSGHVINARLLRVNGVLLYQLTRLDETGRSWREYYSALTGNPVVIP